MSQKDSELTTVRQMIARDPYEHGHYALAPDTEIAQIVAGEALDSLETPGEESVIDFAARMPASVRYVREILERISPEALGGRELREESEPSIESDGGEELEIVTDGGSERGHTIECPNGCGLLPDGEPGEELECPACGYVRVLEDFELKEDALVMGGLSGREAEVIARTLEGWTRSEIADSLGIAVSTVDNKRQRAKKKRAEALALLEAWDPDGAAAELAESASRRS